MPKVFEIEVYRGFFFSNEGTPAEPIHIHIRKGRGEAKFWVTPVVALAASWGMKVSEFNRAQELVLERRQEISTSGIETLLSGDERDHNPISMFGCRL